MFDFTFEHDGIDWSITPNIRWLVDPVTGERTLQQYCYPQNGEPIEGSWFDVRVYTPADLEKKNGS